MDIGCESGPEPVATMALAWRLSAEESRRVDVITIDPESYRRVVPLYTAPESAASSESGHDSDTDADDYVPTKPSADTTGKPAYTQREANYLQLPVRAPPTGLLQRRQKASLAVTVPYSDPAVLPLSKSSQSPVPSVDLFSSSTPLQGCPSLCEPLVPSGHYPEQQDSGAGPSPISGTGGFLESFRRSLSKSLSSSYLPVPGQEEETVSSPVSVLQGPHASPSTSPLPSPGIRPLSAPAKISLPTLTRGLGGKPLLDALHRMMEHGAGNAGLPMGANALRSAKPKLDEATGVATLAFGGLVHKKSVKNMVLLELGPGGNEDAHPEYCEQISQGNRRESETGNALGAGLATQLMEESHSEEKGRRVFIIGRHCAKDGSDFVCSHDPKSLSKIQAFAIAVASCMKKAVYSYI